MKIGIFPNEGKKDSVNILAKMVSYFQKRKVEIFLPPHLASEYGGKPFQFSNIENLQESLDLAISIGGDGTLLGISRELAPHGIPVCGVNLGTLGFLTDIEINELEERLGNIISGQYVIEHRLMLAAYIKQQGMRKLLGYALNDVVVKANNLNMVGLELKLNSYKIADYRADGLIVASPTGSTAYSLSAGGPIVNPEAQVILLTPICPHTFYVRPIVINGTEEVLIRIKDTLHENFLTLDGAVNYSVKAEDVIYIKKAPFSAQIVRFTDRNYYQVLVKKLLIN